MKLINLFEIFDPSINNYIQLNWIFIILPLILIPNYFWLIPSRNIILLNLLINFLFNEFKLIIKNKYISNINLFLRLIIYILLSNLYRLIPYIFTPTRHLLFNLSIALSLWLRFFIYRFFNFPKKTLSHLVPLDSPKFLIHFIVIIELIRLLIRPWTLSIRLSANLISGHLILILLRNFLINFLIISPFSLIITNILLILEISIAFIQAYVFSILLTLYFYESN
jgi:ATP synthase subunit 6